MSPQLFSGPDTFVTTISAEVPDGAVLGARVEVPVTRAIVSYWRPAVYDTETGLHTVELDRPLERGSYFLVWRTGDPEPPAFESFVPLEVS